MVDNCSPVGIWDTLGPCAHSTTICARPAYSRPAALRPARGILSTRGTPDPGQSHDACHRALAAFSTLSPVTCPRRPRCCPTPLSSPWARSGSRRCTSRPGVPPWPRPHGGPAGRSARALSRPAAPPGRTAQRPPLKASDPRPTSPGQQSWPWSLALRPNRAIRVVRRGRAGRPGPPRRRPGGGPRRQAGRPPGRSSRHPVPAPCPGTPGRPR